MNPLRTLKKVSIVALVIMISACVYPSSNVVQGGKETALYFVHAPADASVFVDGVNAGLASRFDGSSAALSVTPGRHIVELRVGPTQIFRQDVYFGDGSILKLDAN